MAMAQLPTRMVQQFPFLMTVGGPHVSQSLLFQFMCLVLKGIMYGTFVKSINEIYRVLYSISHLTYLDVLQTGSDAFTDDEDSVPILQPWQKLSTSLLKHLLFWTIDSLEPEAQKSVEMLVDDGVSPDHTF
jgi:hypothetical protein